MNVGGGVGSGGLTAGGYFRNWSDAVSLGGYESYVHFAGRSPYGLSGSYCTSGTEAVYHISILIRQTW